MDKIAVLIPCFNEAVTIEKVIGDFKRELPDATIYVYDNNSVDGSAELAEFAGAKVRHTYAQGKGNVIRQMFREVDARCYLMVDGDDTYPAESAGEMVAPILEGRADMVVGDRLSSTYFSENKRPFHNAGNSQVKKAINRLFHTDYNDILTGYRAFSYSFVKTFPVLSKGFEIETEMSIHAADKNLSVVNVVIPYRDRPDGSESKLNTFSDGLRVIHMILRLVRTYRPVVFFGVIGAVLIGLGVGFMIPVVHEFAVTGLVPRFPTLIVSGFSVLAGIMSLFSGIILETITWKNRQDFELQLNHTYEEYRKKIKKDKKKRR